MKTRFTKRFVPEELLIFILILLIFLLVILQVLSRFISLLPAHWFEEILRLLFGYMVYFGMSASIRTGEHVAVKFLIDKASVHRQIIFKIVGSILSLVFLVLLAVVSSMMIGYYYSKQMNTAALRIPIYLVRIPFVLACASSSIRYVMKLIAYSRNHGSTKSEGSRSTSSAQNGEV